MRRIIAAWVICCLSMFIVTGVAGAALVGFVNNPTSNSSDWTSSVVGLAGTINSNVDFHDHPNGALQSDFYLLSDGVSLTANGDVNLVQYGTGPGQGNTFSTPLSNGEGDHPASKYLYDGEGISDLTISFASPVLGAGLFVIDYFNPSDGNNPLRISAFDGPNGTGNLLGSFDSVAYNFQNNNMYFMGLTSSDNNIWSLKFYDLSANTGDTTGIDNILFARSGGNNVVPEPASLSLLGLGLLGLGALKRKRGKK